MHKPWVQGGRHPTAVADLRQVGLLAPGSSFACAFPTINSSQWHRASIVLGYSGGPATELVE